MLFSCPVCKERHSVPDRYDNKEYICPNGPSRRSRKTFQNLRPNDLLTRNEPLWNASSTREDVQRAATVFISGPEFDLRGERIGVERKKNY